LEINKEMLKGYIDLIILSLLNEQDLYGYELAKLVRKKSNDHYELKEGTLYIALKRLERISLIEPYWGDDQGQGGRRKYYKILQLGKQQYHQKKSEWEFVKGIIDSFLGRSGN